MMRIKVTKEMKTLEIMCEEETNEGGQTLI